MSEIRTSPDFRHPLLQFEILYFYASIFYSFLLKPYDTTVCEHCYFIQSNFFCRAQKMEKIFKVSSLLSEVNCAPFSHLTFGVDCKPIIQAEKKKNLTIQDDKKVKKFEYQSLLIQVSEYQICPLFRQSKTSGFQNVWV